MKRAYLNRNGEVVLKSMKELGTTWEKINNYQVSDMTKEEKNFLKKYGLKTTIFNVANLRRLGYIHLPKHYIGVVLKHGAVDRRDYDES